MGGVVDILITFPEVVPGLRVIGEIKSKRGEGFWQLLAAMQKEADVRKKWPLGKSFVKRIGKRLGGTKRESTFLASYRMTCIACAPGV